MCIIVLNHNTSAQDLAGRFSSVTVTSVMLDPEVLVDTVTTSMQDPVKLVNTITTNISDPV